MRERFPPKRVIVETGRAIARRIREIPGDRALEKSAAVTGGATIVGTFAAPFSREVAIGSAVVAVSSMMVGVILNHTNTHRADRR